MITNEQIRKMGYLSNTALTELLANEFTDQILDSEFVGVTNGGQFCYDIIVETKWGIKHDKAFVWQENDGKVVAHRF